MPIAERVADYHERRRRPEDIPSRQRRIVVGSPHPNTDQPTGIVAVVTRPDNKLVAAEPWSTFRATSCPCERYAARAGRCGDIDVRDFEVARESTSRPRYVEVSRVAERFVGRSP